VPDDVERAAGSVPPPSESAVESGADSDAPVVYTPPAHRVIRLAERQPLDDEAIDERPGRASFLGRTSPRGPQLGPAPPSSKVIAMVVGGVLGVAALNVWLVDRARTAQSNPDGNAENEELFEIGSVLTAQGSLAQIDPGANTVPTDSASHKGEEGDLEGFAPPDDSAKDHAKDKATPKVKAPATVLDAINASCSTATVDGLSRQIIQEGRCLDPDAFAPVPSRKNLQVGSQVFFYLETPARDHLLKILDAHPKLTMVVNSALRTIPQQYILSKWGAGKRCGVELAATPGESNHESGLALDVREPGTWKPFFEAEGFRWLGPTDKVHFEYRGPGSVDHTGMDVLAFQRLWNRNHADDMIQMTGRFDGETEARLRKAPPAGFPVGAKCGKVEAKPPPPAPKADKNAKADADKPSKSDKTSKTDKSATKKKITKTSAHK
jgi:hypothetical protein